MTLIFLKYCIVALLVIHFASGVENNLAEDGECTTVNGEPECSNGNDQKYSQVVNENQEESNVHDTQNNDYINVMITFYNAKSNWGLQKKFEVTVSSLLKHTSAPVKFFLIGDEESQELGAATIKREDHGKNYTIQHLDVNELASRVEDIIAPMQKHFSYKPGAYYNHALFFLSIVMHKVMPKELKKVIMLDADLKFRADIKLLHDKFRLFNKGNLIGIGRDLQPVYRHTFWQYRQEHPGTRVGEPPPNGLTGFNSGVLLLDLEKMRDSTLYAQLLTEESLATLTSEFHFKGHLGDQDFFTLLSLKYEWLFYVLPCQWNRQLCRWWGNNGYKDVIDMYFNCPGDVKIYHGNCNTPIPDD